MAKKRRDKSESLRLENEIIELLSSGYKRKEIVQFISKKHDVSTRQIDNYLTKAYTALSNEIVENQPKIIKQSLIRFNDLYDRNLAIKNYRECRQVQESILSVFLPKKSEVKQDIDANQNIRLLNINPLKPNDQGDNSTK